MGKNTILDILLKNQVKTAEEWLRLLREHPLPNMAHVVYCPRCDRPKMFGPLPAGKDISRCWVCEESVLLFDESFYSALSEFIKQQHENSPSLFSRVKAEFSDWSFPELEGPLSWLKGAWDDAPRPRGRPQDIAIHLYLANWIESLSASCVVLEVKEGRPTTRCIKPLMFLVEAIDVLQGDYPSVGQTLCTPSGRKRKFGGLDSDTLRQIHEEFRKSALEKFGAIPSLATRDVLRIMRWFRRWPEAKHRIEGNRVREK